MTKLYKQENGIWILQTSDGAGIELVSYDISSKIVDETIYIYNNSIPYNGVLLTPINITNSCIANEIINSSL